MLSSRRKAATYQRLLRAQQAALLVTTLWLLVGMAIPTLLTGWEGAGPFLQPLALGLPLPQPWGPLAVSVSPLHLTVAVFFTVAVAYLVLLLYRVLLLSQRLADQHRRWYQAGFLHRQEYVAFRRLRLALYFFVALGLLWLLAWVGAPGLPALRPGLPDRDPIALFLFLGILAAKLVVTLRARFLLGRLERAGDNRRPLAEQSKELPVGVPADPDRPGIEPTTPEPVPQSEAEPGVEPETDPEAATAGREQKPAPWTLPEEPAWARVTQPQSPDPAVGGPQLRLTAAPATAVAIAEWESETVPEPETAGLVMTEAPDREPYFSATSLPAPRTAEGYPAPQGLWDLAQAAPLSMDPAPAEPPLSEPRTTDPLDQPWLPGPLVLDALPPEAPEFAVVPQDANLAEPEAGVLVPDPIVHEPLAAEPAPGYFIPGELPPDYLALDPAAVEELSLELPSAAEQEPELPGAAPAQAQPLPALPALGEPAAEPHAEPGAQPGTEWEPEPELEPAVEPDPDLVPAAGEAPAAEPPGPFPAQIGWLTQRRAVVAVDLGHGVAKLVQGYQSPGGLVITAAGCFPVSPGVYQRGQVLDPQTLSALVRETMHDLGIKSRRVAACVGGESSILRTVTFPRMTENELKEALKWEAEKYFPFRYEDAVVDFKLADIGTRQLWNNADVIEGQVPVMLGACQRRVVTSFTDTFKHAHLSLIELEPHPLAAFRALRYTQGVQNLTGVVALVDVGLESIYTTIFKHGYPLLHRSVSRSVFAPSVREELDAESVYTTPPVEDWRVEQVLNEIGRSLEAALMQLKPARMRVFITGEGATAPGIEEKLNLLLQNLFAGRLDMEEEPIMRTFSWTRERRWPKPLPPLLNAAPPQWVGAIGLLLRGLQIPVPRPGVVSDDAEADPYREVV